MQFFQFSCIAIFKHLILLISFNLWIQSNRLPLKDHSLCFLDVLLDVRFSEFCPAL